MLYVETEMASYETIEKSLADVYPKARLEHIFTDKALKALGFVDFPPCVFSLDMTWNEYEEMMDELMYIEVDAYNSSNGYDPDEDDEYYQKYLKYGWLWDLFYSASVSGKIKEVLVNT